MEQWGSGAQQQRGEGVKLRDLHNKVVALYPLQHVKQWWLPGDQNRAGRMADAGECDLIIVDPATGSATVHRNVIFFGARMIGLIRTRTGQALLGTIEGDPYQPTSLTWKFLDTDSQAVGFITMGLESLPDTEFEMQAGPDGAMVRGSFRRSQPGDYSDRAQPRQGNQQQQYQPGPGQQGYHGWGSPQQYQQPSQHQYQQQPSWGQQPPAQPQYQQAPQQQPQWGQPQPPAQQPQWGGQQMQQPPAQLGSQPPAWMQQQAPQGHPQWGQQAPQQPAWGQPMNPPAAPPPATGGTTMDAMLAQQPPQQQVPQSSDGPPPF